MQSAYMQRLIPRPKKPPRAEVAHSRPYVPNKYGAIAGESVVGALPTDHFLHALKMRVVKGTLTGGTSQIGLQEQKISS